MANRLSGSLQEQAGTTGSTLHPGCCCWRAQLLQSCPTLFDLIDCSPPGPSAHGILQARLLQWVAMPFSRGSSRPRDWTCISCVSCIARRFFPHWAAWEALASAAHPLQSSMTACHTQRFQCLIQVALTPPSPASCPAPHGLPDAETCAWESDPLLQVLPSRGKTDQAYGQWCIRVPGLEAVTCLGSTLGTVSATCK